jgi:peptidoglycan/LPS O-acetylase OafA/YrhL
MTTGAVIGAQASAPADKASFYRPELDILRFLAFFAIYLTHSLPHDPSDYLRYHIPETLAQVMASVAAAGRFGIQLFFVLSGYLITASLLRERWIRGDIKLRAFYARRILRVWPLYVFVLLAAFLWPWAGHLPWPYLVAYLLLAGNWMTATLGPPASWVSVLWSVSLVQQFYLFWPVVLKRMSRSTRFSVAVILVLLANIARYYLSLGTLRPYSVYSNTFCELDAIAAGILCALALKGAVPLLSHGKRLLLTYSGLALLLGCGYFGQTETPIFVLAGYPCVVAGCLALFVAVCGTPFRFPPLVYLGRISYGLYVFHVLALNLAGHAFSGQTGGALRFFAYWWSSLLLTVALAAASYRWLETPFLRLKDKHEMMKSQPV